MKKFKLTISVLTCLLMLTVFGWAQTTNSAIDDFGKLKNDKNKLLGNSDSPQIVLSVLTQKQSNNSGKMDFIIYGKMTGYKLEMQPVKVSNSLKEIVGEKTITESRVSANKTASETFVEPTTVIPISEDANAIEITWTLRDSYQSGSSKLIVPIGMEAELTTVKFTLLQGSNSVSKIDTRFKNSFASKALECTCVYAELSNSRCGTKCKNCANYIDNVVDGVECTIKCGMECTDRNCAQPACGLG